MRSTTYILSVRDWKRLTNGTDNQAVLNALETVHNATSIYDRFDALISLIDACENYKHANPVNKIAQELQDHAIAFASAIVNASSFEELKDKVVKRRKYKKIDPQYMPWPVPSTKLDVTKFSDRTSYLKALLKHNSKMLVKKKFCFVNETDAQEDLKDGVKYLTSEEREEYRIFISEGKFKKISRDGDGYLVLENFSTSTYSAHDEANKAIFIISPYGEMFAGSTDDGVFHHSSFLAGNPTLFAGTIIAVDGEPTFIDDYSGHYGPELPNITPALVFFRENHLLDTVKKFKMWSHDDKDFVKYPIRPVDKLGKQLAEAGAKKYIDKFTNEEDKKAYIANAKRRLNQKQTTHEVYSELKQAYLQIAEHLLTGLSVTYFGTITNQYTKAAVQDNFSQLAKSFIESSVDLKVGFEKISSAIFTTLNTIRSNAEFIRKQALKCNYTQEDSNIFVSNFIKQVVNDVISGPKTNENLASSIFNAKLMMAIELHTVAYTQNDNVKHEAIFSDFRKMVNYFIENTPAEERTTFSDDEFIVSAIGHAKYFIETKVKLMERLLIEADELQSMVNKDDCCIGKDIKQLIVTIDANMDAFDKATSLVVLQEEGSKLLQKISESKVYLAAKNELLQTLCTEMYYMSADSKKECKGLLTELKKVTNIEGVKNMAIKMSKTPAVIKKRGALGSLSLFDNPIKKKLAAFINGCADQMLHVKKDNRRV